MSWLDRPAYGEVESAILSGKTSKSYFVVKPWPPKQFNCGRCGFEYDGLVPKHECGDPGAFHYDVFILDFCTHCGETYNQFNGRHTCNPYGKHARRTDLSAEAYYMRVWPPANPRHEVDPYKKQLLPIVNLVTQEISWKTIARQQTPQEIEWERLRELEASTDDDCVCLCDGCYELDDDGNEMPVKHCGDDLLGCHESTWKAKPYIELNEQTSWASGTGTITVHRTSVKPTLVEKLRKWWRS